MDTIPDVRTITERWPRRCFMLDITIGGDTWEDVIRSLREASECIEYHCPTCKAASAGVSSGWVVEIDHRPDMTNGKYFDDLAEWQAKVKSQAKSDLGADV